MYKHCMQSECVLVVFHPSRGVTLQQDRWPGQPRLISGREIQRRDDHPELFTHIRTVRRSSLAHRLLHYFSTDQRFHCWCKTKRQIASSWRKPRWLLQTDADINREKIFCLNLHMRSLFQNPSPERFVWEVSCQPCHHFSQSGVHMEKVGKCEKASVHMQTFVRV